MDRLLRLGFFILAFVFLSLAVAACNQSPTSREVGTSTAFDGDVAATSDTGTLSAATPSAFDNPQTSASDEPGAWGTTEASDNPQGSASDEPGAWGTTEASPLTPSPTEFLTRPELTDIRFDFDRYTIRPDDTTILDENAEWMKANPNYVILVEGHADERGTAEYNQALGERRAESAKNYLIAQGVAADRIRITSYGEERPACMTKSEACWAQNRRAQFMVRAL